MKNKLSIVYRKLAEQFRQDILAGTYKPGFRFPGEPTLAAKHGVSRITVRLAMKELESQALVHRRRGSGTYVNPNPQRAMPVAHSQFSKNIRDLAPRMKRIVLEMKWIESDKQLAIDLDIPEDASILYFLRLDKLDGNPMAFDKVWIPEPFARRLSKADLLRFDFFEHWQKIQGFSATKSLLELQAVPAKSSQSKILNIRRATPLLVETSRIFSGRQGTAKFTTWYRHDMYTFKNTIHYFSHEDKST